MVKNEEDIIEAFVRYNLRSVDHMFIADNLSTDGTAEILQALKDEGLALTITTDHDQALKQNDKMTAMYRNAFREHSFEYVFLLDADEFLDLDRERMVSLRQAHGGATAYYVKRVNFLYGGELLGRESLAIFDIMSVPDAIPATDKSMIFHEADKCGGFKIGNGNHHVRDWSRTDPHVSVKPDEDFALIRHLPLRSVEQYVRKSLLGWFALQLREAGVNTAKQTVGSHWRTQYRLILEQDCNVSAATMISNVYGKSYAERSGPRDAPYIDFDLKYEHLMRRQSITTQLALMYETTIGNMWNQTPG